MGGDRGEMGDALSQSKLRKATCRPLGLGKLWSACVSPLVLRELRLRREPCSPRHRGSDVSAGAIAMALSLTHQLTPACEDHLQWSSKCLAK